MITGSIVGGSVLIEAAMWMLTFRKYSKLIETFAVRPEDQSPEAARKSRQALRYYYQTSVFP